ncbi:MAG: deoxyribodipyrimidine photo-lyase [Hyphomicrobiales bacterium]|nr:deoxyribodipyrimidine photo-lyase [Hyphomicrobiales bacterium]
MNNNNTNFSICWLRQDLRLTDNPALSKAIEQGNVLVVYIYDDVNCDKYSMMGEASKWWLHHSLKSLNISMGNNLSIFRGDPQSILGELCEEHKVDNIFWNRCYEPWRINRDINIKKHFQEYGLNVETFNSSLLWEPWEVHKEDKTPYLVFTPFYKRGCMNASPPRYPLTRPDIGRVKKSNQSLNIEELKLLPKVKWYENFKNIWGVGENSAQERLQSFISDGLSNYKEGRNFPSKINCSRLSPHLHFGEISPNQIWYEIDRINDSEYPEKDLYHFKSEIGWREFSYNLLYFNQQLPKQNLYKKFDNFPWKLEKNHLVSWQKGTTGYPIVDAGMRELWQTGYMHNRLRMVVGSFLVKNLLIHWNHGERWFWDCLLDADMASNSASWQWVAGSGADAAPYFRIFNPIMQGQKFDPDGFYTKKYVPELKNMPIKYLFNPWEAPEEVLSEAGVILGDNYPHPIVDMQESRDLALMAFDKIRIKS